MKTGAQPSEEPHGLCMLNATFPSLYIFLTEKKISALGFIQEIENLLSPEKALIQLFELSSSRLYVKDFFVFFISSNLALR